MAEQALTPTTRERVLRILGHELGTAPEEMHDGAKLCDDLGADSLDIIELGMELEHAFEIDTTDAELDALYAGTVGDVIALAERKVAANA